MKYIFYARMPKSSYSGGRYDVLQKAISLSNLGHEVEFVSDNLPLFLRDLENAGRENFKFVVDAGFKTASEGDVDWVIYVPDFSTNPLLAIRALETSKLKGARLALVDFETPLWFNAVSGQVRALSQYSIAQSVSREASLVISLTRTGSEYAKGFYKDTPPDCRFDVAMPAINTAALENIDLTQDRFRILALTRFNNGAHKGFDLLVDALSSSLRGFTITVIHDSGPIASRALEKLRSSCRQYGLELEEYSAISDQRKFDLYSESIVTLFPSNFEGFGMPVIESLAAGAPCIVRELEVYAETVGSSALYFDGTASGLRRQIAKTVEDYKKGSKSKRPSFDVSPFTPNAVGLTLERQMGKRLEPKSPGNVGETLTVLRKMRRHLLWLNLRHALKHPRKSIAGVFGQIRSLRAR